jgi:hypothetical protein
MNVIYISILGFILIMLILVIKSYFFSKKCEECVETEEVTSTTNEEECVGDKCPMRPRKSKN